MKNKFIENELWYLSLAGAFQRNTVYSKSIIDQSEKKREAFKKKLKKSILTTAQDYHVYVSDEVHVNNIEEIISENQNEVLETGKLNFGTVQKLLNLYLKYMWCTDRLQHIPPHCPVDSIILQKSKNYKSQRWTQLNCRYQYMLYINDLRDVAQGQKMHVAEWELEIFNRRAENDII